MPKWSARPKPQPASSSGETPTTFELIATPIAFGTVQPPPLEQEPSDTTQVPEPPKWYLESGTVGPRAILQSHRVQGLGSHRRAD